MKPANFTNKPIDPQIANQLSDKLIGWFNENKRVLPWRTEPRTPYSVWVSEVMLQQTRVSTVIPYFERFMTRFPDVDSLGRASLDEVLAMWSGLGYYRRARALHQGALFVAEALEGRIPLTHASLKQLPGVGDYTAAAIASLAYGEVVAVVDGNVRRVLARVFAMTEPADTPAMKRVYDHLANALISKQEPARFNEAMMELGALVCTPKAPTCVACPLRELCEAQKRGIAEDLPQLAKKAEVPTLRITMAMVEWSGKILLARRHADGLFGGLWEPICVQSTSTEASDFDLRVLGLTGSCGTPIGSFRHVLTHRIFEVRVVRIQLSDAEKETIERTQIIPQTYDQQGFFDRKEADSMGISTLARKVLTLK